LDTPAVYYINLIFAWLLVLLSIWGYATILRKTGHKVFFWLFFGVGWMLLGFSHIFTLGGISSSEWYITVLHTVGYISLLLSVISLMIHLVNRDV
jgi:hypothetical protein